MRSRPALAAERRGAAECSAPRKGKEAIRQFYEGVTRRGPRLELVSVNPATDGSGAMFFQVMAGTVTINVIDLMTFDSGGKITSMKAYSAGMPGVGGR